MPLTPKSRFRIGLRARFIVVISLVLLVIFSLTAIVLLHNARQSLTTDLNHNSRAFAALATRPIGDAYSIYLSYGSQRVQQEVKKFTSLNDTIAGVSLVDVSGLQLFNLNNVQVPKLSSAAADSFDATYGKNQSGAYTTIVQPYIDTNGQHQFAVVYSISTDGLEATISRQVETIITFSIIGLVIAAAVTYLLVNRLFLQPLEAVSRAALAISGGNYSQQIGAGRNDEIGDLARSVNQMATNLKSDIFKLQEVDTMKNEFIMITSHNLRTPLTIIEGYMEILHNKELSGDMRHMMDAIEDGLRQLASFSEDILTIASIEGGKTILATRSTTVDELLRGIRNTYQTAADQKNIKLVWQIDQPTSSVNVSSTHIRGVLRNLLDNTIKFTDRDGEVSLHVSIVGTDLQLKVRDTGIGIAPDEMSKLFQKFHRGTSTYQYNYEGTGIGLYATKLIVQAHGGKVTVASTLGKGSTFTVLIPDVAATTAQA